MTNCSFTFKTHFLRMEKHQDHDLIINYILNPNICMFDIQSCLYKIMHTCSNYKLLPNRVHVRHQSVKKYNKNVEKVESIQKFKVVSTVFLISTLIIRALYFTKVPQGNAQEYIDFRREPHLYPNRAVQGGPSWFRRADACHCQPTCRSCPRSRSVRVCVTCEWESYWMSLTYEWVWHTKECNIGMSHPTSHSHPRSNSVRMCVALWVSMTWEWV